MSDRFPYSSVKTPDQLQQQLRAAFNDQQAALLAEVVTEAYAELVKTHDFNELKEIVRELAQAQTRTEQRLDELAQAQTRTEQRVEELAADLRTLTATVQTLAEGQQDLRQQLGGLAMTVGYVLENEAYKALPALLARDYGLVVSTPLKRSYVTDAQGRSLEVNIFGEGNHQGTLVTLIGESKAQLSIPAIQRFIRTRLEPLKAVFPHIFPILITHMVSSPEVETYAQEQGIALYYSYQF
ncbi:hypothetical protein [Trichothermofontia sp.]